MLLSKTGANTIVMFTNSFRWIVCDTSIVSICFGFGNVDEPIHFIRFKQTKWFFDPSTSFGVAPSESRGDKLRVIRLNTKITTTPLRLHFKRFTMSEAGFLLSRMVEPRGIEPLSERFDIECFDKFESVLVILDLPTRTILVGQSPKYDACPNFSGRKLGRRLIA